MKLFDNWTWRDLLVYFSKKQSWRLGTKTWKLDTNSRKRVARILYTNYNEFRNEFKNYPIMEIRCNNNKCGIRFTSEDNESSRLYCFHVDDLITSSLKEVSFEYTQKANMFLSVIKILELGEGDI